MWGAQAITFVNGVVVGSGARRFESIRVHRGVITMLGGRPASRDTVIDLDGDIVFPGLINAHDHLELNSFPRLKWRPHYSNVREWIADFQPRFTTDPQLAAATADTLADRVWVGGLKNLLSGVTTVCHHNALHRPLRWGFPVRVVRRFGISHSLHVDGSRVGVSYRETPPDWPWIIHAAEGVDDDARREIETLGAMGCIGPNTVLVHGVALDTRHTEEVLASGGALVWCPTSNDFLFGRTADVRRFSEGGRLALGTDSRLSGAGDLFDELRAASATGQLAPEALVRTVTTDAATVLRLPRAGRLDVGVPADLAIVRRVAPDPLAALLAATRRDVRLTMIDGAPLVADCDLGDVFRSQSKSHKRVRVDGDERLMAEWIVKRAAKLALPEPGLETGA
jgi:cytosine/adenosine deaminase-related metal-dependent hydrolase